MTYQVGGTIIGIRTLQKKRKSNVSCCSSVGGFSYAISTDVGKHACVDNCVSLWFFCLHYEVIRNKVDRGSFWCTRCTFLEHSQRYNEAVNQKVTLRGAERRKNQMQRMDGKNSAFLKRSLLLSSNGPELKLRANVRGSRSRRSHAGSEYSDRNSYSVLYGGYFKFQVEVNY